MTKYTTIAGDMWDGIAYRHWATKPTQTGL